MWLGCWLSVVVELRVGFEAETKLNLHLKATQLLTCKADQTNQVTSPTPHLTSSPLHPRFNNFVFLLIKKANTLSDEYLFAHSPSVSPCFVSLSALLESANRKELSKASGNSQFEAREGEIP